MKRARWSRFAFHCLAVLAGLAITQLAHAQQVVGRVESATAYLGQPFEYQVFVQDVENAVLEPLESDDFTARLSGQPSIRSSMSIAGNRVTSSVTTVFSYLITANKAGRLAIPAPVVKVGGKEIRGDQTTVEIIGPTESNLFKIKTRVVPERVYPMQPFTLELQIELRALDKPYSQLSPLSSRVLQRPVQLSIPWFTDSALPKSVQQTEQLDLRRIQTRDGSGFTINGMRRFSLLTFLPEAENFELKKSDDDKEEPRQRLRYTFRRSFFSDGSGTLDFGRAALQGNLVKAIEGTRVSRSAVYGLSDPLTVEVLPVPIAGRPDSWCGVIGELDVQSTITPSSARVGQPLTLTLNLSGTGSLNDAFAPDLAQVKSIADNFRVYDSTSRPTNTGRTFIYSLRALTAGEIEFPPVELAWFNPRLEKFVTGETSPISLSIAESETLAPDSIVANNATKPIIELQPATGLAANLSNLDARSFRPTAWFTSWAAIAVVTALTLLMTGREVSAKAIHKARLHQRLEIADAKLATGTHLLGANDLTGIASVRESINVVAAAISGSESEGMTTEETMACLKAAALDGALLKQTELLLQVCDVSRYGGFSGSATDLRDQSRATVGQLIKSARQTRRQA